MEIRTWIHSADETPNAGSGRRLVVAEVGYKWVFLRPAARPDANRERISRITFESIKREVEK